MPDRAHPPAAPPAPPGHPPAHGEGPGEPHGPHLPGQAGHAGEQLGEHHGPHRPPPRLTLGDGLFLSASFLSTLWAVVVLFVIYPQSPVDAGYAADDVPVMSQEGNVVTVKRAVLAEALASHRYFTASEEQRHYFEERREATLRDVQRDKLFWFVAAAIFPAAALLLFRLWDGLRRRGG